MVSVFSSTTTLTGQANRESPYFEVASPSGHLALMPLKSTEVDATITGSVAMVRVSQQYVNEGTDTIEAVYIFPGSKDAAIYAMEMTVGIRIIKAVIKKKQEAKRLYDVAKQQGKRASLLEQHRPNVFQMNIANILPGDTISVSLRYMETLRPINGLYSFVYPTVVGHRYMGESKVSYMRPGVSDYIAHHSSSSKLTINIDLNSGMRFSSIDSETHKIYNRPRSPYQSLVQLSTKELYGGDRDFVLNYRYEGNKVTSGLQLYEEDNEKFFMLTVAPPSAVKQSDIPAREFIFVIDVSGSMRGFPLQVSKRLIEDLVQGLRPEDMFNFLFFAGGAYKLSEYSLSATPENLKYATDQLMARHGGGGTRLLSALKTAIDLPQCNVDDHDVEINRHYN